jgi:hypothetical protein
MKLWLLQMNDAQEPWFDRMFGFVVRAKDEAGARRLASSRAGDEGPEAWLSPAHSTCVSAAPATFHWQASARSGAKHVSGVRRPSGFPLDTAADCNHGTPSTD